MDKYISLLDSGVEDNLNTFCSIFDSIEVEEFWEILRDLSVAGFVIIVDFFSKLLIQDI